MKFKDFQYKRPDYESYKHTIEKKLVAIKEAKSAEEQITLIHEVHQEMNDIDSQYNICYVRYSINTKDSFYEAESEYWDDYLPQYEEISNNFKKVLIESPYLEKLMEVFSRQYFDMMANELATFSPEIMEEMKVENKLVTKYNKLIASAAIMFEGKEYNLSGLKPFMIDKSRERREKASIAFNSFFEENEKTFDELFDELVKVRHTMSQKLGFENYVEYGYKRMQRTDYNKEMVANFRKQVKESIVPVASKLYEKQKERLGLGVLRYFDEGYEFTSGNATPKGDAAFILNHGKKMYEELSPETNAFFAFMTSNELLDLETKPGKQAGGYCTFIESHSSPFIFSNFNGTSGDVDVLTHEAGHAFQVYQSQHIKTPGLVWPTYESAEIHSMSMEFITWPWMEGFFKEDTDKYKYTHLGSAIKFMPYGVIVDAFQHEVYEKPFMTPDERKACWRELEKQFLPDRNYDGSEVLEKGCWWFRQGHIFQSPFYYIDYTLAQICALQFWEKMNADREKGWQDYLNLSDKGGTLSFLGLVKAGNLVSPFEDGCIEGIIKQIEDYLLAIDDTKL